MDRSIELKQHDKVTQYMTFELTERKPKTTVWLIKNNRSGYVLGEIWWYAPWRQYIVGRIDNDSVFNNGCLNDIAGFLTALNKQQRAGIKTTLARMPVIDDPVISEALRDVGL